MEGRDGDNTRISSRSSLECLARYVRHDPRHTQIVFVSPITFSLSSPHEGTHELQTPFFLLLLLLFFLRFIQKPPRVISYQKTVEIVCQTK